MKTIRNWLIRKLDCTPNEAIPMDIMQDLVNRWANNTVDKYYADSLMNGFSTKFIDDK